MSISGNLYIPALCTFGFKSGSDSDFNSRAPLLPCAFEGAGPPAARILPGEAGHLPGSEPHRAGGGGIQGTVTGRSPFLPPQPRLIYFSLRSRRPLLNHSDNTEMHSEGPKVREKTAAAQQEPISGAHAFVISRLLSHYFAHLLSQHKPSVCSAWFDHAG